MPAESYISQIIKNNASTRRTWAKRSFTHTRWILVPMNFSGIHWTLLACTLCFRIDGGFFYWYVLCCRNAFTLINVAKRIIFSIITHNMHDI